jgi:hypothetical protein
VRHFRSKRRNILKQWVKDAILDGAVVALDPEGTCATAAHTSEAHAQPAIPATATVLSRVRRRGPRPRPLGRGGGGLTLKARAKRKADPYVPSTAWHKIRNRAYRPSDGLFQKRQRSSWHGARRAPTLLFNRDARSDSMRSIHD